jgi:hypothetical protein
VFDGSGRVGRRPGGYAAWEEERRARRRSPKSQAAASSVGPVEGSGPAAPATTARQGPKRPAPSTRSASTVRQLIKQVDKDLAAAHRRQAALELELSEAGSDHEALARLGAEMVKVAAEVEAARSTR